MSVSIINLDKVSKAQNEKQTISTLGQQSRKPAKVSEANSSIQSETYNQTKVALMEIAHSWASAVFELAMQILVLQKVLLKKEDPISHMRFADILASIPITTNEKSGRSFNTNLHLSSIDLLALFRERLAASLQDVFFSKLKQHPNASILLYPHLTKFGSEANESLEVSELFL